MGAVVQNIWRLLAFFLLNFVLLSYDDPLGTERLSQKVRTKTVYIIQMLQAFSLQPSRNSRCLSIQCPTPHPQWPGCLGVVKLEGHLALM